MDSIQKNILKSVGGIVYGLVVLIGVSTFFGYATSFILGMVDLNNLSTSWVVATGFVIALVIITVGSMFNAIGQDIYRKVLLINQLVITRKEMNKGL